MTGTTLKFIMMGLMVLDHIDYFIPIGWQAFFHFISRPVAAVFAYLAVEGFIHTRNRKKYISRLFAVGFLMMLGNMIVNRGCIKNPEFYVNNSIIMTLALGVTSLYVVETFHLNNKRLLGSLLILVIMISGIFFEGGIMLIPFMIICYVNRENPKKRDRICVGITLFFLLGYIGDPNLSGSLKDIFVYIGQRSDIFFFIAGLPFIHLYNGERGLNTKLTKYFFYVFYPIHLWTIAIIAPKIILK